MTAKKAPPRTRSVIGQRALEAVRGSTARRFQWQLRQKLPHREGNFFDVCFEREMSAIEELNRGVRVVASECLGTRGNKVEILLPCRLRAVAVSIFPTYAVWIENLPNCLAILERWLAPVAPDKSPCVRDLPHKRCRFAK